MPRPADPGGQVTPSFPLSLNLSLSLSLALSARFSLQFAQRVCLPLASSPFLSLSLWHVYSLHLSLSLLSPLSVSCFRSFSLHRQASLGGLAQPLSVLPGSPFVPGPLPSTVSHRPTPPSCDCFPGPWDRADTAGRPGGLQAPLRPNWEWPAPSWAELSSEQAGSPKG